MTPSVFLKLGRISNLPTVWTNALAGAVLSGQPTVAGIVVSGLALSLFYVGGMWLNDAFDAEIDTRERADRPIPMGQVSVRVVFLGGFFMIALACLLCFWLNVTAGLVGLCLAGAIVLYDWVHKRTVLSPVIMGATRFLCYCLAAVVAGGINGAVVLAAAGLLAYTAGVTFAAKQEAYDRLDRAWPLVVLAVPLFYALYQTGLAPLAVLLWLALGIVVLLALRRLFRRAAGDVPKAVVTLIAGMALYDAVLIAGSGQALLACIAVAGFALTLLLQRVVSGT